MSLPVDPDLAAIFGSEDRVRTLAALANAETPLTAYRVAMLMEMEPPNVYRELKRLRKALVVEVTKTPTGSAGWALNEPHLRSFLRSRLRVSWSEDLAATARAREKRAEAAMRRNALDPLDLSRFEPGRKPSTAELRRRQRKDRALARARANRSVRGLN